MLDLLTRGASIYDALDVLVAIIEVLSGGGEYLQFRDCVGTEGGRTRGAERLGVCGREIDVR